MMSSEKCLISIDLSKDKEVLEVKQLLEERDPNTYIQIQTSFFDILRLKQLEQIKNYAYNTDGVRF